MAGDRVRRVAVLIAAVATCLGCSTASQGSPRPELGSKDAAHRTAPIHDGSVRPSFPGLDASPGETAGTWVETGGASVLLRWDPCTPISVRINLTQVPNALKAQVRAEMVDALHRTSEATGLRYLDRGDTSEVPTQDADNTSAALVMAVLTPSTTDVPIGGDELGYGAFRYWAWDADAASAQAAGAVIARGAVVVDRDSYLGLPPGRGTGVSRGNVLLHELGHTLALRHRSDSLMSAQIDDQAPDGWTDSDRSVLKAIGLRGGCVWSPSSVSHSVG